MTRDATVLVTGATGLVGLEVVDRLGRAGWTGVVGTSRRGGRGKSNEIAWDLARDDPPQPLRRPWDVIVHAAANTRWTMTHEQAREANVATVAALAPLAGPDTHVVHVSTAYAVGHGSDTSSADPADYRNAYEWSKASAERLARELFPRLSIVRPPLIVGRRGDGRAARFTGMYTVLRGIASSMVPAIVATEDSILDVVPVDDLAAVIEGCAADPSTADGRILTVACGSEAPRLNAAIETIVGAFNGWRAERGHPPFEVPPIVSPDSWDRFLLPFSRKHMSPRHLRIFELLRNFEPYLAIDEPLEPTHTIVDVAPCLAASVRYWADAYERVAKLPVRPWRSQVLTDRQGAVT